jgi:prepilin-type N-terminal cleavage/methylation domain-containing protein
MSNIDPRRGFTLVELLLALAIGGLVVLLAHETFSGVSNEGRALLQARQSLDREANARRWLAATFRSLDVGIENAAGFDGHPDRVAFTAWELVPDGWLEPRRIILEQEGQRLIARTTHADVILLRDSVAAVALEYLLDLGSDAPWVQQWISPVSAPLAVRMRIRGHAGVVDTLVLVIGPRG